MEYLIWSNLGILVMLALGGADRSHMAPYGTTDLVAMWGLIAVAKKNVHIFFNQKIKKSIFSD